MFLFTSKHYIGGTMFCSGYKLKTWVIFIAYCLSAIFQKSPNRLRSSRSQVLLGKGVFITCSQVTGKHQYQSCFATLLKSHFAMAWVLSCNFLHIFSTTFCKNTPWWLLLETCLGLYGGTIFPLSSIWNVS